MSIVKIPGLDGRVELPLNYFSIPVGFQYYEAPHRDPINLGNKQPDPPLTLYDPVDYSTRRIVKHCLGDAPITNVLRAPAVPQEGGMITPSGYGRHQKKSISYLPEKPIDLPIMPFSNPMFSAQNNPLGYPN